MDSKMPHPLANLFKPGAGVMPPTLAGRDAELHVINKCLTALRNRDSIPLDIILYGPRGNGKTVLMKQVRDLAAHHNKPGSDWTENHTRIINAKAGRLNTIQKLARALQGENILEKARIKTPLLDLDLTKTDPNTIETALIETLKNTCRYTPTLITLDETHTLDKNVGNSLFNLSQEIREENLPFLLILAGTPGLRNHLNSIDATFWSRSKKLAIDCLDRDAAKDAITRPFDKHGVTIDPDALDAVVENSQHYPYFLQEWGAALSDRLINANQDRITLNTVKAALPAVDAQRRDYYQDRYTELRNANLLDTTEAVNRLFNVAPAWHDEALTEQLHRLTGTDKAELNKRVNTLERLGYIWCPGQNKPYVPGIPSLMTHISHVRQASREQLLKTALNLHDQGTAHPDEM